MQPPPGAPSGATKSRALALAAVIGVVVGLGLVNPVQAAADEVYLGEQSNLRGTMSGPADQSTLILYAVNVTSSATVNVATAVMSQDPEVAPTRVVVYSSTSAGTSGWAPVATFSQVSSTFSATDSWYNTVYEGNVALTQGTHWVGIAGTTNNFQGYKGAQGGQTSPWTWIAGAGNEWLTTNGGANWSNYQATAWPMLTLQYRTPPVASEPAPATSDPAPWLQEVGMPSQGCDSYSNEVLSPTGVPGNHAWKPSWSQWMNNGAGGPVCTRTLTYDASAAAWKAN